MTMEVGALPTNQEIEEAVAGAKQLLSEHGRECEACADDLIRWFAADTVYDQDFGLDKVLAVPLLVVHELVEIENVKRWGLGLCKGVILDNPEVVEAAHLRATEVELEIALSIGDIEHVRARLAHVQAWVDDPSVLPGYREKYCQLHARTSAALDRREGRAHT